MSHNVETMAYTGEVPWHGLGVHIEKAPSVAKMLQLAGLNWRVERRPLQFGTMNGEKANFAKAVSVDAFAALVRDKDNALFDVVGRDYVPTQNAEAFEFFKEFVDAGDATMETAGSLRGGKIVWGLARLNKTFNVGGKDQVKGYLLVACPHQQGKSLLMKSTAIRVVCNNTYSLALSEGGPEFRMIHRQQFDKDMIKKARETLGLAREQIDMFEENAKLLKKTKMGEQDVLDLFTHLYQDGEKIKVANAEEEASRIVKELLEVYVKAPGADPGNAWGAFNAVTYYVDHVALRTPDRRLHQAWFGKGNRLKQKAMAYLLD